MWRIDERRSVRYGYRSSRPNGRFATLLPFNYPQIEQRWEGTERLEARCEERDADGDRVHEHAAPDPRCRCGVYGLKDLAWVEQPLLYLLADELQRFSRTFTGRSRVSGPQSNWLVAGSVSMWGRVIEGEYGYRAQYAYPETLWLLPPARIGGQDKTTLDEKTVNLAHDLLVVLRSRYRTTVGYASHDHGLTELLGSDELGWFFSWRLTPWGGDRLARALGEIGLATTALPTVADALHLWVKNRQAVTGDPHWNERQLVRHHLVPAFGRIPIDQTTTISRVAYTPTSPSTGKRYAARTVAHHRRVLEQAISFAAERWFPQQQAA